MKAFKSVLSLIILGLIMPAVWAADENTQMGGLPALEARVAALEAALGGGVSPVADLTGTTYCLFGQGSWLGASPVGAPQEDKWAEVYFNPFLHRLDFTSPTEVAGTDIYDLYSSVRIPDYTMADADDSDDPESGTYTLVGNLLTLFGSDNGESEIGSFIMTPDGQVFVSVFGQRSHMTYGDWWETGMVIGVRAANCDGLIE